MKVSILDLPIISETVAILPCVDDVVKHLDVQQFCGFGNLIGSLDVWKAWRDISAWVIMC